MKKLLLLSFALTFSASMALAQATSEVQQTGEGNFADVTQPNHDQESHIVQVGLYNTAVVFQDDNAGGNFSDIVQSGQENDARVTQTSSFNIESWIVQIGIENKATVDQFGRTDYSLIEQSGIENEAVVHQRNGRNNHSEIRQTGVSNFADVFQDRDAPTYPGAINAQSYIDQEGMDNDAFVVQTIRNAEAVITQTGESNFADIYQANSEVIDPNHFAQIDQFGTDNQAWIIQEGEATVLSEAWIHQTGSLNEARTTQYGPGGHSSSTTQSGIANDAVVCQGVGC